MLGHPSIDYQLDKEKDPNKSKKN